MIVYNKIFNNCIDICFENQIPDYKTLNTKFYKKLRKQYPDIPSSVIQCIEKSAIGDLKGSITKYLKTNKLLRNDKNILIALSNIKKPYKKKYSAILLNARNISFLKRNILSFSTFLSHKRTKQNIKIPNFFKKKYDISKFKCGTIRFDSKKQQFFADLYFETASIKPNFQEPKVLGIDRGLNNLV